MHLIFRSKCPNGLRLLSCVRLYFCLTLEEAEPDHYSKLQSPSDDIYSEALYGGDPVKTRAGTLL